MAKILNFIIVTACTICLTVQMKSCIERYAMNKTRIIQSLKASEEVDFLAFTICPSYSDAYKAEKMKELGLDKNGYRHNGNTRSNSTENPWIIFDKITHDLSELVDEISIKVAIKNKPRIHLDFGKQTNAKIETKYDNLFGRCVSIHLNLNVTKLGISNIKIKSKFNLYVYLHHPGQFMDSDKKTKVLAKRGKMHFLDVSYSIIENTEGNCDSDLTTKFDDCVHEKLAILLMNQSNCVVPFLPPQPHLPICTILDSNPIKTYEFYSSGGPKNLCQSPCSSMVAHFGMLFDDGMYSKSTTYLKLHVKSYKDVKEIVKDYTFLSLLAEIGGYTGLLLGVSVSHITTLCEKIRPFITFK